MDTKRIIITLAGFIFLFAWNGYCADKKGALPSKAVDVKTPAEEKKEEPPKVVIKVNGAEIDELDLLGMINTIIPGAVVHGSITEKKQIEVRKKAFDTLITNELMYQEAKKQNIKVKKNEIEKQIDAVRKRLKKNKTTLDKTLKNAKLTMKDLEKEIENSLSISKLNEKIDKELKANVAQKITDTYREEVRLRAEDILKELKAGKDFAKLAEEVSEDMYASKGGDLGFAHMGSIMPEIEAVAEKMNVGDVAGPIWSLYGYHIIKLEEKAPAVQKTFAEVKENLKKNLEDTDYKRMKLKWLKELKKDAKIEYMNEEDRKLMEPVKKKTDEGDKKD